VVVCVFLFYGVGLRGLLFSFLFFWLVVGWSCIGCFGVQLFVCVFYFLYCGGGFWVLGVGLMVVFFDVCFLGV